MWVWVWGRIIPSLQQVFPSRCALTEQRVQVFVPPIPATEKTRPCSEVQRSGWVSTVVVSPPWLTLRAVAPTALSVTSEGVAVAFPICPDTYTSILLQNHVLFLYRRLLSLALAVFPRCSPHVACLQPARSAPGGEENWGRYQQHSCQEV